MGVDTNLKQTVRTVLLTPDLLFERCHYLLFKENTKLYILGWLTWSILMAIQSKLVQVSVTMLIMRGCVINLETSHKVTIQQSE